MHTYYLKIDGVDGDVTEVHHQGWLKLSAHIVSDEAETSPTARGRWTGGLGIRRVGTYDDKYEINAGLHFLNVALPLSSQLVRLFTLWQQNGTLPFNPADAVLAAATESGHDCWRIEFNDVMIVDIKSTARQAGQDSIATISLKFKKTDTDLLRFGDEFFSGHMDPPCEDLLNIFRGGDIRVGDE